MVLMVIRTLWGRTSTVKHTQSHIRDRHAECESAALQTGYVRIPTSFPRATCLMIIVRHSITLRARHCR